MISRSSRLLVGAGLGAVLGAFVASALRTSAREHRSIYIVTPYIDVSLAERVIDEVGRMPPGDFRVFIDTYGGQVTAIVMALRALRRRRDDITTVIPRVAFSGGTLLALCARTIIAGPKAYFSPVDPQIGKCAAREMVDDSVAQQYMTGVEHIVSDLLSLHVPAGSDRKSLQGLFMGREVPHGWPLGADQLIARGLPIVIDEGLQ